MRRARRMAVDELAVDGEINLVPYLDIMVNLIMFMLMTYQVLVELHTISFNPPGSDPGPSTPHSFLTVVIADDRYLVLRDGQTVDVIPSTSTGYDTEGLQRALVAENHDIDPNLVVAATPDVPYGAIVRTLDAARQTADGKPLFPEVVLGAPTMAGK